MTNDFLKNARCWEHGQIVGDGPCEKCMAALPKRILTQEEITELYNQGNPPDFVIPEKKEILVPGDFAGRAKYAAKLTSIAALLNFRYVKPCGCGDRSVPGYHGSYCQRA